MGDCRGGLPHRERGGRARGNDDVYTQPHQLGGQFAVTLGLEVCVAMLEDDVATVDPPEHTESLRQRTIVRRSGLPSSPREASDPVHPRRLLRLILLRAGRGGEGRQPRDEARDETAT
jgi:hypothetical protein